MKMKMKDLTWRCADCKRILDIDVVNKHPIDHVVSVEELRPYFRMDGEQVKGPYTSSQFAEARQFYEYCIFYGMLDGIVNDELPYVTEEPQINRCWLSEQRLISLQRNSKLTITRAGIFILHQIHDTLLVMKA
jgi:hypothetical protein